MTPDEIADREQIGDLLGRYTLAVDGATGTCLPVTRRRPLPPARRSGPGERGPGRVSAARAG